MYYSLRSVVLVAVTLGIGAAIIMTGKQQEELDIKQVKAGLYMINGIGGNVGVRLSSEGVILVDDKFPTNFNAIQEQVRSLTDLPVKYVINTHHHGDHSGGNAGYIEIAEIIAHANARDNMVRGNQPAPPRIVFTNETAVYLGDVEVRAYHFGRGHTNGDAVVYFPDVRTVHGGDLLHGTAPFIDYANGGNSREWVTTLDRLLELDFDTAIPGHGAVMTKEDVQAFQDQFQSVRRRMSEFIGSGVSKETAIEQLPIANLSWTMHPEGLFMSRSVPGFYDEVAAERSR